jgi:Family of unknown function (DUF5677)
MGFDTEGFLGPDAQRLVDKQLTAYPDLFAFAHECSATAMKTVLLHLPTGNRGVSVGIMFARCIAQFQGAIILAERGLPIESMLLTRALYETNFVLGALANKKVTPKELADGDFGNRKKIGNVLLPIAKNESSPEQHAKLAAFIAENAEAKSLSLEEMARRAEMQLIYDGIYRHLSHFAAHPSVTAASGYFVELPDGRGHVAFRPFTSDTPKAIIAACSGIMIACSAFEKAVQTNSEINTEIKSRLDREEVLYQKYRPWDV